MTINERIKAVREATGLSMRAFAESLNLSGSYINKLEKYSEPSEIVLDAICYKHNVNPKWLSGEEPDNEKMFLEPLTKAEKLDELMTSDDEFVRNFLEACADFTDEEWRLLEKIAKKMAGKK